MSDAPARVALVTGASRGIGRATVELLERRGVTTIGLSRGAANSDRSRAVDVDDEDAIKRICEEVASSFGRIDILVNCAGVSSIADPLSLTAADWEPVLRTNLIGSYLCCKHVLPFMRSQRFGRIVNVASIAGRSFSRSASPAYTASKYGVIGVTRQLAAAFGKDGITVNCVAPSQTRTEMLATVSAEVLQAIAAANPIGRLAEPHEIAETIAFLVSDGASYVNGAVIDVNGGVL